jgi:hypothetical protein
MSMIASIASINPTWSPIADFTLAGNTIIDDYFASINKYQETKTTETTETIQDNQDNQDNQDDTTYHKDNIIDPFIIQCECESDLIYNNGSGRYIQMAEYHFDRTEYKYETRRRNPRFNPGKIQRQKGYLKQPGGASCDQRR